MSKNNVYHTTYIKSFSLFSYVFYHPLAILMAKSRRILLDAKDIDPKKHYVFAINHSGAPDFFVVFFGLPLKITLKLVPYRFFIANRFFRKSVVRWLTMSYGGFPAKKHSAIEWGVPAAKHAMERGETVVIFPEGKVSKIDRVHPPKRGVEFLANENDVRIVPVRVKWHRDRGYINSYNLVIGKPFDGRGMKAIEIMDRIYSLKF